MKCEISTCKGVSQLVRFPRKREILEKWITAIGNPHLKKMATNELYKTKRICVDHFENNCFQTESTVLLKILKPDAVPTLGVAGSKNKCAAHDKYHYNNFPSSESVLTFPFAKCLKDSILNLSSAVDRTCVLLFKTMNLDPKLDYNCEYDTILGFRNTNSKSSELFARKVLVFMVRGLYTNWQQLISFVFCEENLSVESLSQSILDVLHTCFSLKFRVVGTVCEINDYNIAAIDYLKNLTHTNCLHSNEEFGYESFLSADHEIIILYDVSSLLKSVRDEFMQHECSFVIDDKEFSTSWNDLLYFVRNNDLFKSNEPKYSKKSIRKYLKTLNNQKLLSYLKIYDYKHDSKGKSLKGIYQFLNFFSQLFDSLNGSNKTSKRDHILKTNVTLGSKHWEFWTKSLEILKSIKFKSKSQTNCIEKWISSLYGIMHLWRDVLQRSNFKSFSPKYLQLEELENILRQLQRKKKKFNSLKQFDYKNSINYHHDRNNLKSKMSCSEFLIYFSRKIKKFPNNQLPLYAATRPLFYNLIQTITDKNFNDDDYRNLDSMMNRKPRTLITSSEFKKFKYAPMLQFSKTQFKCNFAFNKQQILHFFSIKTAKKQSSKEIYNLMLNKCENCFKILFEKNISSEEISEEKLLISSTNFSKAFGLITSYILPQITKLFNKCKIKQFLTILVAENVDLTFLNCEKHDNNNMITKIIEICIENALKCWVKKLNLYLSRHGIFMKNTNFFRVQTILSSKVICSKIKKKELKEKTFLKNFEN